MPEIDVVIPTWNRPRRLARCLEALTRQSYTDFGVIVVDDASDPPAEQTLPRHLFERLDLRVLRNERQAGPAHARNRGVGASNAEYIAFIDDDVCADPHLLRLHREALLAADRPVVVIGPLAEPPDWRPQPWTLWEARQQQKEYDRMAAGEYRPTWRQLHTGNAFMRRAAFLEAGGFDERFTRAEDIELGLRLLANGNGFVFRHDAVGWHYSERSLESWLNAARAYARFDVAIDELYPQIHWLAAVRYEFARKSAPLRAVRFVFGRPLLRPAATTLATLGARVLYRMRLTRPALYALSVANDLQYDASLKEAVA